LGSSFEQEGRSNDNGRRGKDEKGSGREGRERDSSTGVCCGI